MLISFYNRRKEYTGRSVMIYALKMLFGSISTEGIIKE